jgi:hypothetical protein
MGKRGPLSKADWLRLPLSRLFAHLSRAGPGSDRKFRLFGCACVRRVWDRLTDECWRRSVEAAEGHADGTLSDAERDAAHEAAAKATQALRRTSLPAPRSRRDLDPSYNAAAAATRLTTARESAWMAAGQAMGHAHLAVGEEDKQGQAEFATAILRDLFYPYGPAAADPAWLAWRRGTVVRLARAAYDERRLPEGTLDPGRLAVLSDALEEAGCDDADILGHLREPAPHARGCWVVDQLLSKV